MRIVYLDMCSVSLLNWSSIVLLPRQPKGINFHNSPIMEDGGWGDGGWKHDNISQQISRSCTDGIDAYICWSISVFINVVLNSCLKTWHWFIIVNMITLHIYGFLSLRKQGNYSNAMYVYLCVPCPFSRSVNQTLRIWFNNSLDSSLLGSGIQSEGNLLGYHYGDVIMNSKASQITGVSIVCSTVWFCPDQRKHQSSASLTFVRGIHRWTVNFPHKGPVTRKCFHLMTSSSLH